ncbi:hypothetical protein PS834_03062 [Pseudomonas fluorescens]|nr:hypothetical protein PS834_03062 [Pseudomonas fluorescens]
MRYNTGNPVEPNGSDDPRDLFDNIGNIDLLEMGPEESYPDRLNESRRSRRGMDNEFDRSQDDKESRFQTFLLSSGYQDIGIYAAGLEISARNQIFLKDGEYFRVAASTVLPYTTTGSWPGESDKFVSIGDAALRQDLAAPDGSKEIGFTGRTVEDRLKDMPSVLSSPYSAAGNGISDDTAAFASFELAHSGKTIDLGGKTYSVTSIPKGNAYVNGHFKIGSYSREPYQSAFTIAPTFNTFGGKLRKLKEALSDPLNQHVGIVWIGDSITFGTGTGEGPSADPRDGTLSDPRDVFSTPSFVNEVKRYLGENYAGGASPVLSNWPASPSGESIAAFTASRKLYPAMGKFTTTPVGSAQTATDVSSPNSVLRFQRQLGDGDSTGASYTSIKFMFTGYGFTVAYTSLASDATFYELRIDGVLVGTYDTAPGVDGAVEGYGNTRHHSFAFVRNKEIEIRTSRGGRTGTRRLRLEAILVDKVIRVSNQGINGSDTVRYKMYNLAGNTSGDGVAYGADDSFVFVQLGTNDRLFEVARPRSENAFSQTLGDMLAVITGVDIILMVANPVGETAEAGRAFSMQRCRDVIYSKAKSLSLDFIDNYTALKQIKPKSITSDEVHPNRVGHSLIARNIIGAIEGA